MTVSATDLMPTELVCRKAGICLRHYHSLVQEGKAPAPIRGVPAELARAWLDSRGVTTPLPAGDFVRVSTLSELAGIEPTNYYVHVRKKKAPQQLKGVLKHQAEEWLRARAAAKPIAAAASQGAR